jgi:hypothetical protein
MYTAQKDSNAKTVNALQLTYAQQFYARSDHNASTESVFQLTHAH